MSRFEKIIFSLMVTMTMLLIFYIGLVVYALMLMRELLMIAIPAAVYLV